jgi:hypothetical protein
MTASELYYWVITNYGNRGCTIKGIEDQLGISHRQANHLTYLLGYRNTKLDITKRKSLNDFSLDAEVKYLLEMMRED